MLQWPLGRLHRTCIAFLYLAVPTAQQDSSASVAPSLRGNNITALDHRCGSLPRRRQPAANFRYGSLHDVVGHDGVLVISLLRKPERFDHSSALLQQAGIWPTEFPAVDAMCLQSEELEKACYLGTDQEPDPQTCSDKHGRGCNNVEQAIAESHRRALQRALQRSSPWTAILEEDTVPVRPERWSTAFKKAWERVPEGVKIVRLSWCNFPGDHEGFNMAQDTFADAGDFLLANWTGYEDASSREYNAGGCTGGYMVHRSIIPELLNLFPCCCAWDCCLEKDFFERPVRLQGPRGEEAVPRGMQVMLNMDAWGSIDYAMNYTFWGLYQSGVMVQDARELPSARDEMLGIETRKWSAAEKAWITVDSSTVAVA